LSSIPPGTYDLTSYHLDATFSQSESIRYRVTDAVGTNVLQTGVIGDSSYPGGDAGAPGVAGLSTPLVQSKGRTIRIVSSGSPITITYDSTAAVDKELPLNGFKLQQVQPADSYGDIITTDINTAMLRAN